MRFQFNLGGVQDEDEEEYGEQQIEEEDNDADEEEEVEEDEPEELSRLKQDPGGLRHEDEGPTSGRPAQTKVKKKGGIVFWNIKVSDNIIF